MRVLTDSSDPAQWVIGSQVFWAAVAVLTLACAAGTLRRRKACPDPPHRRNRCSPDAAPPTVLTLALARSRSTASGSSLRPAGRTRASSRSSPETETPCASITFGLDASAPHGAPLQRARRRRCAVIVDACTATATSPREGIPPSRWLDGVVVARLRHADLLRILAGTCRRKRSKPFSINPFLGLLPVAQKSSNRRARAPRPRPASRLRSPPRTSNPPIVHRV